MARTIDFGEAQGTNGDVLRELAMPARRKLAVRIAEQSRTVWLLPFALCSFGRSSERDVPLRLQPTTTEENKRTTFQISSHHFDIRYSGEGVTIVDCGSSNGTDLKSAGRLTQNKPAELGADDEIKVAGVLSLGVQVGWRKTPTPIEPQLKEQIAASGADLVRLSQLLIGHEKPGRVDFVRIRRLDNCPNEEYILLFGQGLIDTAGDAMIQLPKKVGTGSRGLDLGDDDSGLLAHLSWKGGDLVASVLRDGETRHNGRDLKDGESVALQTGDTFDAGSATISVAV